MFCIIRDGKSSPEIIPDCSCSATCPPLEGGPGDRPASSYILLLATPWPFATRCCCAEQCVSLSGAPKHLEAAAGSGCSEVLLGALLLSLGKSKLGPQQRGPGQGTAAGHVTTLGPFHLPAGQGGLHVGRQFALSVQMSDSFRVTSDALSISFSLHLDICWFHTSVSE